jgi:hypothetical protein
MLAGLQKAGEKLKDCYDKTTEDHGNFMLWAPSLHHNTSYSSSHSRNGQIMSPNGGTYIINTSKGYLKPYKQRLSDHQPSISQPQAAESRGLTGSYATMV